MDIYSTLTDTEVTVNQYHARFLDMAERLGLDSISFHESYFSDDKSLLDVAKMVSEKVLGAHIYPTSGHQLILENPETCFMACLTRQAGRVTDVVHKTPISVTIYAPEDLAVQVIQMLDESFEISKKIARIDWWYKGPRGEFTAVSIKVEEPTKLYDEFYPWFEDGWAKFMEDFKNSSSSLLFLAGPPGCGKTSLIRQFIYENGYKASVAYHHDVFDHDTMFIDYVTSDKNLLVIEDADTMLSSRSKGSNDLMSRFLNISDGLIKTDKKKIIFTSNLTNFSEVDEALIRPGRCFGSVFFRELTYDEACKASRAAGLIVPKEHKDYSLGELFHGKHNNSLIRQIGFPRKAV